MTPRRLRAVGTACLLLVAAFAAVVCGFAAQAWPAGGVAFLALMVTWPLLSLLAWRQGHPAVAWGLMALYAAEGAFTGLSWGGLLLYGLVPYAAGNLAFRWARRADPAPLKPNA